MDRRSWLWRRKSSEKSPGETESSGSISSHSERFSDDQAYSNHITQSPEVTSKAASSDEELNDSVKILTEKLSAALLNISAKEDLVKQHAKVAEEAVSGWEKAENEVLILRQQLEAVTQKNYALEERVGHLDGALKECLRQLRQAREEQDQKIHEAVTKKTREWESTKSELENQLVELQFQLEAAKAEATTDTDLQPKLEVAEKEISALKLELLSRAEELEFRIIERDLSTQAAETASKQHLDSIRKVAKLEAECGRLKAVARKAAPANDHRLVIASSVYVESFTDSQSDSGERLLVVENDMRKMSASKPNECNPSRSESWASVLVAEQDQFKNGKALVRNLIIPLVEINLMDDFLEMERLAALPETESGSCPDSGALSDQPHGGCFPLKAELEAMINRTSELEETIEKMETDKLELEMALTECQGQLKSSRYWLEEAEAKLLELQTQLAMANEARKVVEIELKASNANLKTSGERVEEVEVKLMQFESQLAMINEAKREAEVEVEATSLKKEVAESRLVVVEAELKTLLSRVGSLEEEVQKERALSGETVAECQKLKEEISRMQCVTELQKAASSNWQDKELAVAATKFAECQKTIASLGRQLKSLATLEDFLIDSEKPSEISRDESQCLQDGAETLNLHSSDMYLPEGDAETSTMVSISSGPLKNGITSERSRNGFDKLFARSKSRSRNENQCE